MSTNVRQLAYGVMQTFALHKSPTVVEYRVLEASNARIGRQIDVSGSEEVLEQCNLLTATFKQLAERIPCADMQWMAFAIYQDVLWSTSEERSSLSASLIRKASNLPKNAGEHSWDIIHFTAQIQASLYSLRMAKQALDAAASLRRTLPAPMQKLRKLLSTLPTIAEWPTVDSISQKLATASKSNVLKVITDILGVPAIEVPKTSSEITQSNKRKVGHGLLRSQRDPKRPTCVNPYAVLSNASLE
jgi:hypothetical protein